MSKPHFNLSILFINVILTSIIICLCIFFILFNQISVTLCYRFTLMSFKYSFPSPFLFSQTPYFINSFPWLFVFLESSVSTAFLHVFFSDELSTLHKYWNTVYSVKAGLHYMRNYVIYWFTVYIQTTFSWEKTDKPQKGSCCWWDPDSHYCHPLD